MRLEHMTWYQVENRVNRGEVVILPVGSTEQHGPMGMIGTDTICADAVAQQVGEACDAVVAPALGYTPAPFNTSFPGTVSVSEEVFQAFALEVIGGLLAQGFSGVFIVNGHGANLAPLKAISDMHPGKILIKSWWEPESVNAMRKALYGDWEGMHATPSEISITQHLLGALPEAGAANPPQKLNAEYFRDHAGDRHGPPEEHRATFPDGRVGSHSALARQDHGKQLLNTAVIALSIEFQKFSQLKKDVTTGSLEGLRE